MAGIYIHIPFCKKACHYCDFHFSTSLKLKEPLLAALKKEIIERKNELGSEQIDTIYFGGGTPSILDVDELKKILDLVLSTYKIATSPEITLEANPDDLSSQKLKLLRSSSINRFSIGIQSFFDVDLLYMNRAHNANESERAVKASQDAGFENITVDLIYGTPTLSDQNWLLNLEKAIALKVPHISSYALTVEEKTPLASLIQSKKLEAVDDAKVADQFQLLIETLVRSQFEHYEISNFAKEGHRSKHNTSYWQGKPYLGLGPGAHSYNGSDKRKWNISNNALYIEKLGNGEPCYEEEILTEVDRFNEFIMTRIRLIDGISINEIQHTFGSDYAKHLMTEVKNWDFKWYAMQNNRLILTNVGKIISDDLASRLFKST